MNLLNNGYYNSQAVQVLNAVEYDEYDNPIGLYESPSDPSSCNFTVSDNSRCKFVDSNCFQQQVSTCYMTVTGLLATDTITVFGSSAVPTLSANRMDFVVGSKYYGISIFRSAVLWAYYPMCESVTNPSRHIYHDCSGNGNHATLINGAVGNESKQDEFHYLQNGFNADYIQVSPSKYSKSNAVIPYNSTTNLTIRFKIYNTTGLGAIVSTESWGANLPGGFAIFVDNANFIRVSFRTASTEIIYRTGALFSGINVRIDIDLAQSVLLDKVKVYFESVLQSSTITTGSVAPSTIPTSVTYLGNTSTTINTFAGLLDYVTIDGYFDCQNIYSGIDLLNLTSFQNYGIEIARLPKHIINNTDVLGHELTHIQDDKSFLPSGCYLQQYSTNANLKLVDSTVGLWYGSEGDPYKVSYNTLCLQDPWNEQVFIGNKTKDYKLGPISTHLSNLTPVQKLTERVVRNVVDDALIEDPAFSHDVTVTAADLTYSLYNAAGYIMNGIIDWGDGTTQSVNTTATQTITKTYVVAGTYTVKFTGIMNIFGPSYYGGAVNGLKVVKVNNWGNVSLRLLTIGTTSVTTIPNGPITGIDQSVIISFASGFAWNATKLTNLPPNLFLYCSKATSFGSQGAFSGCTSLTGQIPENLFRYCPNLTSVASTFDGCTGLTGKIPEDLLRYNTKLTSVGSLFQGCSGLSGSIPTNLLKYNVELTNPSALFFGCTNLTGTIPVELFRYNQLITTFYTTFFQCLKLSGSIPEDLFKYNTLVTNFAGCFRYDAGLTGSIPTNIFKYNTEVTIFGDLARTGVFANCTGLTGTIPPTLLSTNTKVTSVSGLFESCEKLTGDIPSGLFTNNTLITDYRRAFINCYGLTSIPTDLFRYSGTNTTTFENTFSGCTGITSIPSGLFDYNTNVTTFANTFYNTRITTIPSGLFVNNTKVTTFAGTFQSCTTLSLIPSNLFDTNTLVTSFASTFKGCTSVQSVPVDLFRYNTAVTNISNLFNGCTNAAFTTVDANIFRYMTAITNMQGVFNGLGTAKTFTIPIGIFDYNTVVTNMSEIFRSTKIADIPVNIFRNNTEVITFAFTFSTGDAITQLTIDNSLFQYNTKVTSFASTFQNTKINLPSGLFDTNSEVTTFNRCFANCSLVGQSVPVDFFRYNTKVTSFESLFQYSSLSGDLPEDLFYYNSNVTIYASTFINSSKLVLPTRLFNTANLGKVTTWDNFMNVTQTSYSPTGTIQKIWGVSEGGDVVYIVIPTKTNAFNNCTALSNYAQIPATWT